MSRERTSEECLCIEQVYSRHPATPLLITPRQPEAQGNTSEGGFPNMYTLILGCRGANEKAGGAGCWWTEQGLLCLKSPCTFLLPTLNVPQAAQTTQEEHWKKPNSNMFLTAW